MVIHVKSNTLRGQSHGFFLLSSVVWLYEKTLLSSQIIHFAIWKLKKKQVVKQSVL